MSEIIPSKVVDFIREMIPSRSIELEKIAQICRDEWIPLVQPEVGQFLQVMVQVKGAKRILEIGTGIGYSTIILAQAARISGGEITTIEIDRERYERACQNFLENKVEDIINPICGDAGNVLDELPGSFDFIFIDAAKGQYQEFSKKVVPLLIPGGVLVMDNIFLNGWVIDRFWPERRKKTMVVRLRELLESLKDHPQLITSLIPMGDGLALCVRR